MSEPRPESSDPAVTPTFSLGWVAAGVFIITALELLIALVVAPAVLVGRLASPMLRMRLEILMHLTSFWAGGLVVGLISPRVRLLEPAVAAFVSVGLVFLTSVFLPNHFLSFSLGKLLVGGGIAFALALAGAYLGERLMGNLREPVGAARPEARRLPGQQGALEEDNRQRHLDALRAEKEKLRR